jgi:hypothetical protein
MTDTKPHWQHVNKVYPSHDLLLSYYIGFNSRILKLNRYHYGINLLLAILVRQ